MVERDARKSTHGPHDGMRKPAAYSGSGIHQVHLNVIPFTAATFFSIELRRRRQSNRGDQRRRQESPRPLELDARGYTQFVLLRFVGALLLAVVASLAAVDPVLCPDGCSDNAGTQRPGACLSCQH